MKIKIMESIPITHDLRLEIKKCYRECDGACLQVVGTKCHCKDAIILDVLEELQQYRSIGTVDECREAREKQKPKIPDIEGDDDIWICPCCGMCYDIDYDDYEYCPECGQHIEVIGNIFDNLELLKGDVQIVGA